MMRSFWVLAIAVAAACGKPAEGQSNASGSTGPTATSSSSLPHAEMLRAEACGCTTEECADKVLASMELERRRFEETMHGADVCLANRGFGGNTARTLLRKLDEFVEMMCACQDVACTDHVDKEMIGWMLKNAETFKDVKPTKAEEDEADEMEDRMRACKAKLQASP
jgi:hypothetical protein